MRSPSRVPCAPRGRAAGSCGAAGIRRCFRSRRSPGADVDAVVVGQGEQTFAELVDRFAADESVDGVAGSVTRDEPSGEVRLNPPRATCDINQFPEHDYGLIAVDRYFALKRERQLDYVTSQGCRFRCTFCSDPTVYGRNWFGLEAVRVGTELQHLWHRYGFTDVGFQDETFFTHANRVVAIAEEILRRDLRFTWMATMRADQGARLDEAALTACRHSGPAARDDRARVGLATDARLDEEGHEAGTGVRQRGEVPPSRHRGPLQPHCRLSGRATRVDSGDARRREEAAGARSRLPGGAVLLPAVSGQRRLPRGWRGADIRCHARLEEWAAIEENASRSPWVDDRKRALIERFGFYQRIGWATADAVARAASGGRALALPPRSLRAAH